MANRMLLPLDGSFPLEGRGDRPHAKPVARPRPHELSLASAAVGQAVSVVDIRLEGDLRAWLTAVGIGVGERVTVLRRAAFGGPLHVRTSAGGEFALNLGLAQSIHTSPPEDEGKGAGKVAGEESVA